MIGGADQEGRITLAEGAKQSGTQSLLKAFSPINGILESQVGFLCKAQGDSTRWIFSVADSCGRILCSWAFRGKRA